MAGFRFAWPRGRAWRRGMVVLLIVTVLIPVARQAARAQTGPAISLTPASGTAGTTVTVRGSGFSPNSVAQVRFAGSSVAMPSVSIGRDGVLRAVLKAPSLAPGTYTVSATAGQQAAGASFTILSGVTAAPAATPSPTPAAICSARAGCATPPPSASATPTRTPTAAPTTTSSPTPTSSPVPAPASGGRRVVGYFPLWAPNGGYTAQHIDFQTVTHVAHFSVVPRGDGSIEIPDWGPFPDTALLTRAHGAGAKVVLVVGGDHAAATQGFAQMAGSAATRGTFVTNLMGLVTKYGYDGVDIDWEFPQTTADRANLTLLISDLRAALGTGRSLSVAAPASDWYGRWFDWAAITPKLDWIGAMTYSLANPSWSSGSFHNAALYVSGSEFSVEATRTYYRGVGVPSAKLLIGLPFFGIRFDGASDINQPLANRLGGDMTYPQVAALVGQGWNARRDMTARVPYLVKSSGGGVITYDDPTSIQTKCQYTVAQGLGGVIIWHLGQDRTGTTQPLLAATAGCR
jgi:chitinase